LKTKGHEHLLEAEKIFGGVGKKDVYVFRESREAVVRDRKTSHNHVLDAMHLK
jgi:hypothetical protein